MTRILVLAWLAIALPLLPAATSAAAPEPMSIPLGSGPLLVFTRHAEKAGGDDPCLTAEGRERAERLVGLLERMPVKALFSTDYCRTRETLDPLSEARGIAVRIHAPMDVAPLIDAALDGRRGAVVVAGHSNTLPALVGMTGADIPEIDENDYGNLYVVFLNKETGRAGGVLRLSY